jgi:hypothetical protein
MGDISDIETKQLPTLAAINDILGSLSISFKPPLSTNIDANLL